MANLKKESIIVFLKENCIENEDNVVGAFNSSTSVEDFLSKLTIDNSRVQKTINNYTAIMNIDFQEAKLKYK